MNKNEREQNFCAQRSKTAGILTQIVAEYVEKSETYEAKQKKHEALVEKRKNQLKWAEERASKSRVTFPSWIDNLLDPIAKEMVNHMPDRYYEILGPFGLSSGTSIHFYKKGTSKKDLFENDNCVSITFVPKNLSKGELLLRDYTTDTHEFSKGTIGEVNGYNYPLLPIKDSIDELMVWMKQQNAKEGV